MKINFKKEYLIGIGICIFILLLDVLYFFNTRWFFARIIIALTIGWSQIWIDFFKEQKRQKEREEQFLQLVRALVNTVRQDI